MERDHERVSGKPRKQTALRKKLLIALVSLVGALAVGTGIFLWIYSRDDGLIFDNVYFMDQNLGGMTQEEARTVIDNREKSCTART